MFSSVASKSGSSYKFPRKFRLISLISDILKKDQEMSACGNWGICFALIKIATNITPHVSQMHTNKILPFSKMHNRLIVTCQEKQDCQAGQTNERRCKNKKLRRMLQQVREDASPTHPWDKTAHAHIRNSTLQFRCYCSLRTLWNT